VTRAEPGAADRLAQAIRSHWGIEKSPHWVLDVAFPGDESRKRKENAPENLAAVRHIAPKNLLMSERGLKRGIVGRRLRAGRDEGYLQAVPSRAPQPNAGALSNDSHPFDSSVSDS
jgi:hypothetical protein